jgi:hypothetical protein
MRLNRQDIDFLLKYLADAKIKRDLLLFVEKQESLNRETQKSSYEFNFTDDFIESILDELSDLLILKGFDSNDDLNSMGSYIEGLIDQFSSIYYD